MSSYLGQMMKRREATCAGCETTALTSSGDRDHAAWELRHSHGWAIRAGLWNCSNCKNDPARQNARYLAVLAAGGG